jgi:hypothetical protein
MPVSVDFVVSGGLVGASEEDSVMTTLPYKAYVSENNIIKEDIT